MTESKEQKPVEEGCCADQQCQCEKDAKCECNSATAEGEAPTREMSAEELQTALKMAEAKVLEHYDLYVRAMAELENTRRRAADDVQKARKFGIEKFAENLLPVVDSLEKALEATKDLSDSPIREGMETTYRQMIHALDVAMVPAPEGVTSGTVVEVFQRGWMIADRVLRPAMVSVAQ